MERRHPFHNFWMDVAWLKYAKLAEEMPDLTEEERAYFLNECLDEAFRKLEAKLAGEPFVPREPQWWPDSTGRFLYRPDKIIVSVD